MIHVIVRERDAEAQATEPITSGSVGLTVSFRFSEDWDGLRKVAIFRGNDRRIDVALMGQDSCVVPHEVLADALGTLKIGVYGTGSQGQLVKPTVWTDAGRILPGAEPSEIEPTPATETLVQQILEAAEAAREIARDLREDADAGAFDGEPGSSIWITAETPLPASGGMAFTQLTGRSDIPPAVGDIILRSSRYVYQVVEVTQGGIVIGTMIGDIKGEQGDADTIWRTTASITGAQYSYGFYYSVSTTNLVGRNVETPKAGDLVIGPEPNKTGTPTYLYAVDSIRGSRTLLNSVGSIKGATGDPGAGFPSGGKALYVLRKKTSADYDTEWSNPMDLLSDEAKQALLQMAEKVAYVDDQGQTYYRALHDAFYPPRTVVLITAVFTQGSTAIYDDTALDDLKQYLTVTAKYDDNTTAILADSAYSLSGLLDAPSSAVTVLYGSLSTTFTVNVIARPRLSSISAVYTQSGTVYTADPLDGLKDDLVVTATYSDSSTQTVEAEYYTLSGTLTEGSSTIAASYGGKTDTFTVTVKYLPSGYIKDGLVFFLDGMHGASANQWTDLIGDKSFALTNCTLGSNGVVFNGSTSYGEYNGAVTSDWENETIEVVVTAADPAQSQNRGILYQPLIDGHIGISMHFGYHGNGTPRFALCTDGVNRDTAWATLTQAANKVGGNADRVILNGTAVTNTDNTNYAVNTTGKAVIGCRKTTSSPDGQHFFEGTIHAIRIYSRKLSQAEILANQSVDAEYYGV